MIQRIKAINKRYLIVVILITGSFTAILNQTTMVTLLPPVMDEFGIAAAKAQWLTTVFMLLNGVMIPTTGFLIERFTTRQLFITSMIVFFLGSVLVAVSPTFQILMTGRVIQSLAGGILLPLMQAGVFLIFPVGKRGTALGIAGLVIAFAPALGPTFAGWINDILSWRYVFYLILPIAVIVIFLAIFKLENVQELTKPKIDIPSVILSSIGFGGLLYGFSIAGTIGWESNKVLMSLLSGTAGLIIFTRRQLKLKEPFLEMRVFKDKRFSLMTALVMIGFPLIVGVETLVPLYIQDVRGLPALQSGLVFLPGAFLMGLMSPLSGRIFDKFGIRFLAIGGFAILTGGTIPFMNLNHSTSLSFLTIMYAVRMIGAGMVLMPATTAALNQLDKHLVPHGNAVNTTMRMMAGSIGTALFVTIMSTVAANANTGTSEEAMLHGLNTAFIVTALLGFSGFVLSLFIKNKTR